MDVVEGVPVTDPDVYEANLHSVRASLHEGAGLLDLAPPDPSTGSED